MNSNRTDSTYRMFRYKKYVDVIIQMKNGNGMLIAYRYIKGSMKRISISKNNISMRNYREFLRLLNVNLIIKSKKKIIKIKDINMIMFKVTQILSINRQFESEEIIEQENSKISQNSNSVKKSNFWIIYIVI